MTIPLSLPCSPVALNMICSMRILYVRRCPPPVLRLSIHPSQSTTPTRDRSRNNVSFASVGDRHFCSALARRHRQVLLGTQFARHQSTDREHRRALVQALTCVHVSACRCSDDCLQIPRLTTIHSRTTYVYTLHT